MTISIEGIKFNYDPEHLEKTGAINLRRNEKQTVSIPEWESDRCSTYDCSPVAYRIDAVPKHMHIQASFFVSDQLKAPLKIRGVAASAGHILGDTSEEIISAPGSSGYITFCLLSARVCKQPIGVYDLTWRWQYLSYKENGDPLWRDFQTTRHRIYLVLSSPTEPWEWDSTKRSNIHIPWTEVLDFACMWAVGEIDLDEAAKAITIEVYNLGKGNVKDSGNPRYALTNFHCTEFLDLLRGGFGRGKRVNCDDCATVVSTFANILGCSLSQSGMGSNFETNDVIEIGKKEFKPEGYLRHAVAWKGGCTKDDAVFDAFLQVDGAGVPGGAREVPLTPTNIVFGDKRSQQYHYRLFASGTCEPRTGEQKRRSLGQKLLGEAPVTDVELLDLIKARYSFNEWIDEQEGPLLLRKKALESFESLLRSERWQLESPAERGSDRFQSITELIAQIPDADRQNLATIIVYECGSAVGPNEFLAELLTSFTTLDIVPVAGFGQPAFAEGGGRSVLFRRGEFVCLVQSAGREEALVLNIAKKLDESFGS